MKAYLPVEPGWYEVTIIDELEDDFKNKIAEPEVAMPLNDDDMLYDILMHYYVNCAGLYCCDTYYRGEWESTESFGAGRLVQLYHEVEIYQTDWSSIPKWVEWITFDPDGRIRLHNMEPDLFPTQWGAPADMSKRAKYKGDAFSLGYFAIPLGVDWRTLKEKRADATHLIVSGG